MPLRSPRFFAVLSGVLLVGSCAPSPPRFGNVLIVMIDTLRSDHVSAYGYERQTTPFLDELAAEGIRLQGYSASSWTKPSIATFLTGLYPQRHQAIGRRDVLAAEVPFLPEILTAAGFHTAAFVANLNAGRKWGFGRGFEVYRQTRPAGKLDGGRMNRRVFDMLSETSPPFALYLHYVDPHDPYRPETLRFGSPDAEWVQPRRLGDPAPDQLAALVNQYDSEIAELDEHLRELFAEMDRHGLLEDTLVVVTADHGEEFGEHGGLTHGHTLFEEVLRVPLVFWARDGLPARQPEHTFHQVDFLPTVLEALDVSVPEGLDGESRWGQITSGSVPPPRPEGFHLDVDDDAALALRDGSRKLIHGRERPYDRLFDLERDPGEQNPVESSETTALLRRQVVRMHNRLGSTAPPRTTEAIDPELARALAALGYVSSESDDGPPAGRLIPPRLGEQGLGALSTEP